MPAAKFKIIRKCKLCGEDFQPKPWIPYIVYHVAVIQRGTNDGKKNFRQSKYSLMRYCLRKNDESEEYNDGSGIVYIKLCRIFVTNQRVIIDIAIQNQ